MIRLFRKIRNKLLSEKNYSMYILYASGEIVLVMVGILLALQVDNWNDRRKEIKYEEKLLVDLRKSIIDDYQTINMCIQGNERSKRSCEIILSTFEEDLPYHDSMALHFEYANLWWKLLLREYAYDNAKSFGLDFIKDDTTRIRLSQLYEQNTSFAETLDERESQYYYNAVAPILIDLFESIETSMYRPTAGNVPIDYEKLKSNVRYRNILRTHIGNRNRLLDWLNFTLGNMKMLDERLKNEIESR